MERIMVAGSGRARLALVVVVGGLLTATAVSAQETCEAITTCPEGSSVVGAPPDCGCTPAVTPEPEPEPVILTCEANFGCADGSQIGVGTWPDCGCRDLSTPLPAPGVTAPDSGPGPASVMGLEDTCAQFFECQPGYTMLVWNGRCVCGDEMLATPD